VTTYRRRADKQALWARINSPAVVSVFPADEYQGRADKAVQAWIDDILCYYDIDPASPDRWEQAFWYLAVEAFPNFRLVGSGGAGGAPNKIVKRAELLQKFDAYQAPMRGSKYKQFLADHATDCDAGGIKTVKGLQGAILQARDERESERRGLELYLRDAAARALGLNPTKSPVKL
jgi:hypothetical protein